MKKQKSFEKALFDGDIDGPNWPVVDTETGQVADPGSQEFGHTVLGRNVKLPNGTVLPMTVIDFTEPSDAPVAPWHENLDMRSRRVQ